MTKTLWLTATALTLVSSAAQAYVEGVCCRPQPRWYLGLGASLVKLDDVQFDHPTFTVPGGVDEQQLGFGFAFNGQIGYRITRGFRTELELSYRSSDVDEDPGATAIGTGTRRQPVTAKALMANGYYDFINATNYTPYIGAGIGAAQITTGRLYSVASTNSAELEGTAMAYQFMTGIGYRMNSEYKPVDLYMGYRYFATEDIEDNVSLPPNDAVTFPYRSHSIEVGARVFIN